MQSTNLQHVFLINPIKYCHTGVQMKRIRRTDYKLKKDLSESIPEEFKILLYLLVELVLTSKSRRVSISLTDLSLMFLSK